MSNVLDEENFNVFMYNIVKFCFYVSSSSLSSTKHIQAYTHKISWWCPDFICFVCNNTSYEPTSCQKIYQSTQIYTILFCKMMMMEYGLYIRLYIIIWHECVILFVEYGPCVRVCVCICTYRYWLRRYYILFLNRKQQFYQVLYIVLCII